MNAKIIQFLLGVLTILVGKGVSTAADTYATVLRMEVKMDESTARMTRISEKLNEHGRDLLTHERRITILEHKKGG